MAIARTCAGVLEDEQQLVLDETMVRGSTRTGCEFSVAQKLLALAKVEDNSGIRERCGQKNGEALCQSMGRECASSQRFFVRALLMH